MSRSPRSRATRAFATLSIAISCLFASAALAKTTVGEHHSIDLRSPTRLAGDSLAGGPAWRQILSHPGATYIAIHFASFDLGPADRLVISDPDGDQAYTLTGRGRGGAGTFWARHVKGDTAVLELWTEGRVRGAGFAIDEYAGGTVPLGAMRAADDPREAICGTDDKENAVCYTSSHSTEYDRGRAVARLLIQGSSLCTGWLASAQNHLVTNEHCISSATAALNTDYEFMGEAPSCGSGNCQLCYRGPIFDASAFIQDSPSLDYALVQLQGDPQATYGYLQIDDRAAIVGEQIYIPQHPGGRAKELGIFSTHSLDAPSGVCHVNGFEAPCSGSGYSDVGYMCDTEGGSSGSPVLATSSHKVIALHHCASCENRGVPITLVCDQICGFFGPECTVDADCDDADPCTSDICEGGSCTYPPGPGPCCGNQVCEQGEDCETCASDCPSGGGAGECGNGVCEPALGENCVSCAADCNGKQNGKPSNRFCCGDGGGENPVPCSDSRCDTSPWQCGSAPPSAPYCCGDFTCDPEEVCSCELDCGPPPATEAGLCTDGADNDCDGLIDSEDPDCCGDLICGAAEDSCSCSVDCGPPTATETDCSNGKDDDCDGLIDGADPDCGTSCGAKNDPCAVDDDCCSNRCKRNGRCA